MEFGKYYYYYSIGAPVKLPSCRPLLLTTPAMTRPGPPAESRVAWYTNTPLYLVKGRVRARVTVRVRVRVRVGCQADLVPRGGALALLREDRPEQRTVDGVERLLVRVGEVRQPHVGGEARRQVVPG